MVDQKATLSQQEVIKGTAYGRIKPSMFKPKRTHSNGFDKSSYIPGVTIFRASSKKVVLEC